MKGKPRGEVYWASPVRGTSMTAWHAVLLINVRTARTAKNNIIIISNTNNSNNNNINNDDNNNNNNKNNNSNNNVNDDDSSELESVSMQDSGLFLLQLCYGGSRLAAHRVADDHKANDDNDSNNNNNDNDKDKDNNDNAQSWKVL